jgi:nitroreductase
MQGGYAMDTRECILGRRSIRKFKSGEVDEAVLREIVEEASYSPSWKHTQTIRYIAVEGALKNRIGSECTSTFPNNGAIIQNAPLLIAVTVIKGRCGYERDGSFTTNKGDRWEMFNAGIATQTFCLAAHEKGVGTCIMGIFDDKKIAEVLNLPEDQIVGAVIAAGYPDEEPEAPARKSADIILTRYE